jgi:LmbE family N-acetylglucosaminyl deacetylase
MPNSALVVAPHPDDEAIGCGGTILLHLRDGEDVNVVFLTSGERGIDGQPAETVIEIRENEARDAANVLGIPEPTFLRLPDHGVRDAMNRAVPKLASLITDLRPTYIYLPHEAEDHPDHQAAIPAVRAALHAASISAELRAYEVWTPMTIIGWPMDITPVMAQKLRAVRCYRSQLQTFRYDRAVRGLNQYRGCLAARSRYAEVFQFVQSVDPAISG